MKRKISVDVNNIFGFVSKQDLDRSLKRASLAYDMVREETGVGANMMGWKTLPSTLTMDAIKEIKKCALSLSEKCEVVVIIGVGGSYLGAKSAIEALTNPFAVHRPRKRPHIVWAGHNLSADYLFELKEMIATKEVGAILISKSGTTLEPALAFRVVRKIIEDKYGRIEAAKRIVAVTDESKGALRQLALMEGYRSFVIPDNVGGRFSVLTPVGLLPMALAGIDIEEMMEGAYYMEQKLADGLEVEDNPVLTYAAVRNLMYERGKKIELLAVFEPRLSSFVEWWQQLFGESEGKDGKGLFPVGATYTTDLHSLGQYVQDGERVLFETFIDIDRCDNEMAIRRDKDDIDGLNFLVGKSIGEVNVLAKRGVAKAHTDGGVPNLSISVSKISAENLGVLIYFFQYACAISAYMLEINPFNQNGVEEYKKNIASLTKLSEVGDVTSTVTGME